LREGTSCGGVGARCAPLSRLRAGRVCGWVDRCWIVIWWYFSVLDRRLLCELRGGTVPRGPYARVSKFDIVQVFLGRPAFQWKHEGMASEPRFIRGRVDIGVGIKMACAASISLSLFLFLALSLSLSFSVYSSTMTPDSTMAHRCRCVATVSRAVNNDRADIANRVATTVASSSPCRPRNHGALPASIAVSSSLSSVSHCIYLIESPPPTFPPSSIPRFLSRGLPGFDSP